MGRQYLLQLLKAQGFSCCKVHPTGIEPWPMLQKRPALQQEPNVRLQTSIQSKVIGILWKVGGNRRRRGNGSCCPAASGTSGWLLFELELLGCHNTYELTLIRIRLGKT